MYQFTLKKKKNLCASPTRTSLPLGFLVCKGGMSARTISVDVCTVCDFKHYLCPIRMSSDEPLTREHARLPRSVCSCLKIAALSRSWEAVWNCLETETMGLAHCPQLSEARDLMPRTDPLHQTSLPIGAEDGGLATCCYRP